MIGTLTWKEVREHQSIWLTMAFMTVVLGCGLPRIISQGDYHVFLMTSSLTILGLAVTYGVVCGAMMFAGEHESGTLAFLDVFHGRRGRLWVGKALIGALLAIAEALAVALCLWRIGQEPPSWGNGFLNRPEAFGLVAPTPVAWFAILPAVTLEACAWGLLGSSMTRRVLAGASIGAAGLAAAWLVSLCGPVELAVGVRLVVAIIVLAMSSIIFMNQAKDAALGTAPIEAIPLDYDARDEDARAAFLDRYDELERDDELLRRWAERDRAERASARDVMLDREAPPPPPEPRRRSVVEAETDAKSPGEVLWWLVVNQYQVIFYGMLFGALVVGLVVGANVQILWPIATLLLGIVCGVAAFAPEQRELSYQFLAAQHFPLRRLWGFKILVAAAAAVIIALPLALGAIGSVELQRLPAQAEPIGFLGPVSELMGPFGFFGVWLAYGFGVGQIVVWLCRKNILAILLSLLIAGSAIGLWLPSTIAGGMGGWQIWLTPAIFLLASCYLVRAWAGGRIQERKPLLALGGFAMLALAWAFAVFGCRAWELPDVGPPMDVIAFRAEIPVGDDIAAKEIHSAVLEFNQLKAKEIELALQGGFLVGGPKVEDAIALVRSHLKSASRLPTGVLEAPRSEGAPTLLHLEPAKKLAEVLVVSTRQMQQAAAVECLDEVLTLSRSLRKLAPAESYLAGVEIEKLALNELDSVLSEEKERDIDLENVFARQKPTPELLRRAFDVLELHAARTPPVLDCVRTECFRSTGMLLDPQRWNLSTSADRRAPRWLRGAIALSLDTPWESERKARLWQLAWAGLFRGFETPAWQHPEAELPPTRKSATRSIMSAWLPGKDGISRERVASLLDSSWLADDRLLIPAESLRSAALRSQVRIDTSRLAVALAIHRMDKGKAADSLDAVAPLFPAGLPTDPYSGQPYGYVDKAGNGRVWSTGPDRTDNGGRIDGEAVPDADPRWRSGSMDLVRKVPTWR